MQLQPTDPDPYLVHLSQRALPSSVELVRDVCELETGQLPQQIDDRSDGVYRYIPDAEVAAFGRKCLSRA